MEILIQYLIINKLYYLSLQGVQELWILYSIPEIRNLGFSSLGATGRNHGGYSWVYDQGDF